MGILLTVILEFLFAGVFSYLDLVANNFDCAENKFVGEKKELLKKFFRLPIFLFLLLLIISMT